MITAGSDAADCMTFTMSNVKINSSSPADAETGLKRTYQFQAVLNASGGTGTATEKPRCKCRTALAA